MASLKDRYVDDHVYCVLSEYEKVLLGNKKKFSVPKTEDKKDKEGKKGKEGKEKNFLHFFQKTLKQSVSEE